MNRHRDPGMEQHPGREGEQSRGRGEDPSRALGTEYRFEQVFKSHFKSLHAYSSTILRDTMAAEEVVQQIFMKLWERKEELDALGNIGSYLYRAVHNESLNHIKHLKVRASYQQHAMRQTIHHEKEKAAEKVGMGELENRLQKALLTLPEQCRTVFQLSRFEELKYREIADRLGVSVKAVEKQMGKALASLRVKLADFLPVLLLLINFFK